MPKKETGIYPMGPKKPMPGQGTHKMPGQKMPMKDSEMKAEMKKKKKKMMP